MKLNKLLFLVPILLLITNCSGGGSSGGSGTPTVTLFSITVTPANPSIAPGTTEQFTATGTYSDHSTQDITSSVAWGSNTASATIDTAGLATAISTGSITITASSGSISGSTLLTVATVASLQITPDNPSIYVGKTESFTAMGTLSNNKTQVLTSWVSWSSSDKTIVTISNGLATAVTTDSATITATWRGSVSGSTLLTVIPDNVIPITVNGSLCSSNSYPNKPCVSVTICSPGSTDCLTINDILLDTGSYGLRIFKSLLTGLSLTQVASGSGSLTECIQYADGSADWGPVQIADVVLGNESAVRVPIQVIDSTFGTVPRSCGTLDSNPSAAGFNGIMGVGLLNQDCGSQCTSVANNGMYYSCNGSKCSATTVTLSNQVKNPVSLLPLDNNGIVVQLPVVPLGGVNSVDGDLIIGIGTRSNNVPSVVTTYPADPNPANLLTTYGDFITIFDNNTTNNSFNESFIDSGSNGLFFDQGSINPITICDTDWFCASPTLDLSATTEGYTGSPSGTVSFQIGDTDALLKTSNNVFIELGGPEPDGFDWGLPFFLGRIVYVGIEGKTSSLGTGPYWAY